MPGKNHALIHTLHLIANAHAAASYSEVGREWEAYACSAIRRAIEILSRKAGTDDGYSQPAPACVDALCRPSCHDWSAAEGCLMVPSRLHYQDKAGKWDCDWLAGPKPTEPRDGLSPERAARIDALVKKQIAAERARGELKPVKTAPLDNKVCDTCEEECVGQCDALPPEPEGTCDGCTWEGPCETVCVTPREEQEE